VNCSSCQAPVRWETTVRNKPIPLDPEPVPDAHLFIRADGKVADDRTYPAGPDDPRYETHFVTCPNAEIHRRRR
jgi:hypothetical protein